MTDMDRFIEAADALAEAITDWQRENSFRLGQVQGFAYGVDRLHFVVRDCWLKTDQIIWSVKSTAEASETDHAEMIRQIEIYRMQLALSAVRAAREAITRGTPPAFATSA